jgi:low temperature requirement protein LtrA
MYGAYAYLTNQVPPETTGRRLLLVVGMGGFLTCALAVPHVFGGDGVAFGLGFVLVTAVHSVLYALIHRAYVLSFALPNLAAAGAVTAAGAVHGAAADALWVAAVLLQNLAPLISSRVRGDYTGDRLVVTANVGALDPAHFVERHGLLLIIVFGESVIAIGTGLEGLRVDWTLAAGIALALALAAALWWSYFLRDEDAAEEALRRVEGLARFRRTMLAYYYSFIPMLLGVAVLATGVKASVGHLGHRLPAGVAVALAGGVALFLLGNVAFRLSLGIAPVAWRALAAAAALAMIPLGSGLAAVAEYLGMTLVLVAMLVAEDRRAATSAANGNSDGQTGVRPEEAPTPK